MSNEYGTEKRLNEILEELVLHCFLISSEKPIIKIILPQRVIQNFSDSFKPIERNATPSENKDFLIKAYNVGHGSIELFDSECHDIKELC